MVYRATWKEEFSYKSFSLKYKGSYGSFIEPLIVQIKPTHLIIYKVFVTIYTLTWLILSSIFTSSHSDHNWFYYMKNQVYVIMVAYYILTTSLLIHVYYKHFKLVRVRDVLKKLNSAQQQQVSLRQMVTKWSDDKDNDSKHAPKALLLFVWALYTTLVPLTYTVTLQSLNNISVYSDYNNWLDFAVILNFNLINSVLITIELLISLIAIRVYHFYFPILYTCFYFLTVYLLWLINDSKTKGLTYEIFNSVGFQFAPFMGYLGFIFVVHIFHALSYRVKLLLYYDVLPKYETPQPQEDPNIQVFQTDINDAANPNENISAFSIGSLASKQNTNNNLD